MGEGGMLPKEINLEESIENYLVSAVYEQGYAYFQIN